MIVPHKWSSLSPCNNTLLLTSRDQSFVYLSLLLKRWYTLRLNFLLNFTWMCLFHFIGTILIQILSSFFFFGLFNYLYNWSYPLNPYAARITFLLHNFIRNFQFKLFICSSIAYQTESKHLKIWTQPNFYFSLSLFYCFSPVF